MDGIGLLLSTTMSRHEKSLFGSFSSEKELLSCLSCFMLWLAKFTQ
jgi:hypothetical protein